MTETTTTYLINMDGTFSGKTFQRAYDEKSGLLMCPAYETADPPPVPSDEHICRYLDEDGAPCYNNGLGRWVTEEVVFDALGEADQKKLQLDANVATRIDGIVGKESYAFIENIVLYTEAMVYISNPKKAITPNLDELCRSQAGGFESNRKTMAQELMDSIGHQYQAVKAAVDDYKAKCEMLVRVRESVIDGSIDKQHLVEFDCNIK